jgi:hypothetical protein
MLNLPGVTLFPSSIEAVARGIPIDLAREEVQVLWIQLAGLLPQFSHFKLAVSPDEVIN